MTEQREEEAMGEKRYIVNGREYRVVSDDGWVTELEAEDGTRLAIPRGGWGEYEVFPVEDYR